MLDQLDLKKFVVCPLSDADINSLQGIAGRKITPGVRAFLARVGFPQNVVPAMFQDEAAWAAAQRHAPGDAFVFAQPGEVLFAERRDGSIIEIDGATHRIAFSSFADFLAEFIFDPGDPREQCWAVQLSFATCSERKVRDSLAERLGLTFAPDWEELAVSPAAVRRYCAHANVGGNPPLKRMEYMGWATPIFFLDVRVDRLHFAAFKTNLRRWAESGLGFKLCNYGVLPKDLPTDEP